MDESTTLGRSVYVGYMKGELTDKVAVKVVDVPCDFMDRFKREVQNLIRLGNLENVVSYRASGRVKGFGERHYIVMELCCKDNLKDLLEKGYLKGKYEEIKKVLLHVMRGLSHIHGHGSSPTLHRDLKLDNVLLSMDKKSIKICDFGLSKQLKDNQSKVSKSGTEIGTDGWGSPEHYMADTDMSIKSDIFSAGLLFCYILSEGTHACGDMSYKRKSNIIEKVPIRLPDFKCDDPALAADLVNKMLEFNPDNRPSSKDVLAHPFFWSNTNKLTFVQHTNSYIQGRKRVPCDKLNSISQKIRVDFERLAHSFKDWGKKLSPCYLLSVSEGKFHRFGGYDHSSLAELIRFIRNMAEHYIQHDVLKVLFKNERANVWVHFSELFPELLPGLFHIFYKHLLMMNEDELREIKAFLSAEPSYSHLERIMEPIVDNR